MFYYIYEWYNWFYSFSNGIKKDEITAQEIQVSPCGYSEAIYTPFEEPLPTQRIEKIEAQITPDIIPFEEPLQPARIYSTGRKYK